MSFIKTTGEKKLMLFSGRAHPELAEEVAEELGIELTPTTAYDFANGEIFVRYKESVRGCDAFVIQSHPFPLNKWIDGAVHHDRRAQARVRQAHHGGHSRSTATPGRTRSTAGASRSRARLMADFFKTAGANRLMAVDLHTAQIQGFFDGPVDHLFALPLLAVARRTGASTARTSPSSRRTPAGCGSPSAGRRPSAARRWRSSTRRVTPTCRTRPRPTGSSVRSPAGPASCDDMIDTGGTITKAADALFEAGAADVIVAATHAVLSEPAVDRLKNSRISEVVVTDTLPISEEQRFDKLTVLSIAPLIARGIREVFDDGSVTSLFDGHS